MATYTITYSMDAITENTIQETCVQCNGTGSIVDLEETTSCSNCEGTGQVSRVEIVLPTNVQTHTHEFASEPTFAEIQAVVDSLNAVTIVSQGFME